MQEGTRPNPDAMLPSVEILAVKIRFGVREDERTLMSYLRVFPNIRTLHIQVLITVRTLQYFVSIIIARPISLVNNPLPLYICMPTAYIFAVGSRSITSRR
jgi:hypothetical protein